MVSKFAVHSIYLLIEGQQQGPYTVDQIRQFCFKKEILQGTPAWYEGLADWTTVAAVLADVRVAHAEVRYSRARRATDDPNHLHREYLRALVRAQNILNGAMVASTLKMATVFIPLAGIPFYLAVGLFEIYAVYRLASTLHVPSPWIYCLGMFFPLLGLVIEIWLFAKANEAFRAEGIHVGWIGAKASDIPA